MPAPIVLQDPSGLAQGISTAGGALGQALGQRMQQSRQAQGLQQFQSGLEAAQNDPNAIARAYSQALASGADPATLQSLQQSYNAARKQNAFKSAFDEALDMGGLNTPEGQNAFLMAYGREGGDPFEAIKLFQKDKKGDSVFDKKIDEFMADSVIEYMQGGDEQKQALTENLDYLEENLKNVGRAKGLVTGEWAWNSKAYTEYRNRGNLALDSVIKVFNKAGVLPQRKLEWIRETFGISPMDTQEQIQGKINALRSLAKEAGGFQDKLGGLIERYGTKIPRDEFIKLQNSADATMRKFDDQVESPASETVVEKLPTKGVTKGAQATNSETGEKYIYNGSRWVKQKKG